jgi:hypothetical protein
MISYVLFGGVLLLLTVAVFMAAVRSEGRGAAVADSVQARKDTAIEALRVLEFEHQTGKVSEEEYGPLRRRLELEAVQARDAAASEQGADGAGGESAGAASPAADPDAGAASCGICGRLLAGSEAFCPACGAKLGGGPAGP